jgi:hypothetical protein
MLPVASEVQLGKGCVIAQVPVTDHDPDEEETDMMDEAIVPCDMVSICGFLPAFVLGAGTRCELLLRLLVLRT